MGGYRVGRRVDERNVVGVRHTRAGGDLLRDARRDREHHGDADQVRRHDGGAGRGLERDAATTNRLTYTGTPTRTFKAEATISLSAAAATNARLHLYKNGSLITGSTVSRTLADTATNAVAIHALVSLAPNDYVELWCETDDGDDITIQNGVVSITSID